MARPSVAPVSAPAAPSTPRAVSAPVPRVRAPDLGLEEALPRHWFGGNVVASHVVNGVSMLFPAGERFFVRSVRHYLPRVEDEGLRARIKGFFGQEVRHSREHERVNERLEEQGFEVQSFLRAYEKLAYGRIEPRLSPALRLSITAALEHYTAILAEDALRRRLLDDAHPAMRALLLWHACEEIEHRDVAFELLQQVDPSLRLRLAGLALATLGLLVFWQVATLRLLRQEQDVSLGRLLRDWRETRARRRGPSFVLRGVRQYLRRDFHPSECEMDALAADYLASAGLA